MDSAKADPPGYTRYNLNAEQPGRYSVLESERNTTLPAKIPIYRRKEGIIIIILVIAIVIGVVVGGAVGGTKASKQAAQRDSASASTATVESVITTMTTLPASTTTLSPNTTTLPASTTTLPASSTTVTSTLSAPSPTPSNCVWEGTAPFCDGKCHTGFTQIKEDNCGNGACCLTGFKVYCCQE